MTYNEIKDLCETRGMPLRSVAEKLSMSPAGLQRAIQRETLPIRKVLPLCRILNITVQKFFGLDGKLYNDPHAITELQEKLAENEETICSLKEQNAKLIDILHNMSK